MSQNEAEASARQKGMRKPSKTPQITRRGFLAGSGMAVVGVTLTGGLAVSPEAAWAQSFPNIGADVGATLVRMARDIYPHDKLAEKFYLQSQEPYDAKAASDPGLKKLLVGGVASLDAAAQKKFGKRYRDVPTEEQRVSLLKDIESGPFFKRIQGDMVTGLYNNKEVWPFFGYEGSSWQKGGYLHRGFDDIDWL
jgi:hypothetical protein